MRNGLRQGRARAPCWSRAKAAAQGPARGKTAKNSAVRVRVSSSSAGEAAGPRRGRPTEARASSRKGGRLGWQTSAAAHLVGPDGRWVVRLAEARNVENHRGWVGAEAVVYVPRFCSSTNNCYYTKIAITPQGLLENGIIISQLYQAHSRIRTQNGAGHPVRATDQAAGRSLPACVHLASAVVQGRATVAV